MARELVPRKGSAGRRRTRDLILAQMNALSAGNVETVVVV